MSRRKLEPWSGKKLSTVSESPLGQLIDRLEKKLKTLLKAKSDSDSSAEFIYSQQKLKFVKNYLGKLKPLLNYFENGKVPTLADVGFSEKIVRLTLNGPNFSDLTKLTTDPTTASTFFEIIEKNLKGAISKSLSPGKIQQITKDNIPGFRQLLKEELKKAVKREISAEKIPNYKSEFQRFFEEIDFVIDRSDFEIFNEDNKINQDKMSERLLNNLERRLFFEAYSNKLDQAINQSASAIGQITQDNINEFRSKLKEELRKNPTEDYAQAAQIPGFNLDEFLKAADEAIDKTNISDSFDSGSFHADFWTQLLEEINKTKGFGVDFSKGEKQDLYRRFLVRSAPPFARQDLQIVHPMIYELVMEALELLALAPKELKQLITFFDPWEVPKAQEGFGFDTSFIGKLTGGAKASYAPEPEYDFELMPNDKTLPYAEMKENVLYIQLSKSAWGAFTYTVKGFDEGKKPKTGTIDTSKLKIKNFNPKVPLTLEALKTIKKDILKITSASKHTLGPYTYTWKDKKSGDINSFSLSRYYDSIMGGIEELKKVAVKALINYYITYGDTPHVKSELAKADQIWAFIQQEKQLDQLCQAQTKKADSLLKDFKLDGLPPLEKIQKLSNTLADLENSQKQLADLKKRKADYETTRLSGLIEGIGAQYADQFLPEVIMAKANDFKLVAVSEALAIDKADYQGLEEKNKQVTNEIKALKEQLSVEVEGEYKQYKFRTQAHTELLANLAKGARELGLVKEGENPQPKDIDAQIQFTEQPCSELEEYLTLLDLAQKEIGNAPKCPQLLVEQLDESRRKEAETCYQNYERQASQAKQDMDTKKTQLLNKAKMEKLLQEMLSSCDSTSVLALIKAKSDALKALVLQQQERLKDQETQKKELDTCSKALATNAQDLITLDEDSRLLIKKILGRFNAFSETKFLFSPNASAIFSEEKLATEEGAKAAYNELPKQETFKNPNLSVADRQLGKAAVMAWRLIQGKEMPFDELDSALKKIFTNLGLFGSPGFNHLLKQLNHKDHGVEKWDKYRPNRFFAKKIDEEALARDKEALSGLLYLKFEDIEAKEELEKKYRAYQENEGGLHPFTSLVEILVESYKTKRNINQQIELNKAKKAEFEEKLKNLDQALLEGDKTKAEFEIAILTEIAALLNGNQVLSTQVVQLKEALENQLVPVSLENLINQISTAKAGLEKLEKGIEELETKLSKSDTKTNYAANIKQIKESLEKAKPKISDAVETLCQREYESLESRVVLESGELSAIRTEKEILKATALYQSGQIKPCVELLSSLLESIEKEIEGLKGILKNPLKEKSKLVDNLSSWIKKAEAQKKALKKDMWRFTKLALVTEGIKQTETCSDASSKKGAKERKDKIQQSLTKNTIVKSSLFCGLRQLTDYTSLLLRLIALDEEVKESVAKKTLLQSKLFPMLGDQNDALMQAMNKHIDPALKALSRSAELSTILVSKKQHKSSVAPHLLADISAMLDELKKELIKHQSKKEEDYLVKVPDYLAKFPIVQLQELQEALVKLPCPQDKSPLYLYEVSFIYNEFLGLVTDCLYWQNEFLVRCKEPVIKCFNDNAKTVEAKDANIEILKPALKYLNQWPEAQLNSLLNSLEKLSETNQTNPKRFARLKAQLTAHIESVAQFKKDVKEKSEINSALEERVLARETAVNHYQKELNQYLKQRRENYKRTVTDLFSDKNQDARELLVKALNVKLGEYKGSGDSSKLLQYINEQKQSYPGFNLRPILCRLQLQLKELDKAIPKNAPDSKKSDFPISDRGSILLESKLRNSTFHDSIQALYNEIDLIDNFEASISEPDQRAVKELKASLETQIALFAGKIQDGAVLDEVLLSNFKNDFDCHLHSQDDLLAKYGCSWITHVKNIALAVLAVVTGTFGISPMKKYVLDRNHFFYQPDLIEHISKIGQTAEKIAAPAA